MGIRIVHVEPGALPAAVLERLGEIVVTAYGTVGALEGDDGYVPELRDLARRVREAVVLAALDEADGTPLGCVTYVPGRDNAWAEHLRDGEASIRMLAVDPAAQGRGVGTALVEACVARARSDRRRAVFLHSLPVMAGAQRIYERLGFRRVPERDWVLPDCLLMGFVLDLGDARAGRSAVGVGDRAEAGGPPVAARRRGPGGRYSPPEAGDTPSMNMPTAAPLAALLADARAALPATVAIRRRLHRTPEVGLDLPATQAIVVEELRALGLEPRLGTATTSVTAVIEGARPGPTILLRADMDGLPLTEETGLEFTSGNGGAMHACGHDTHMAMLLGAARLLTARRDALAGRVLLMFQPGEEGHHGARFMLDEGLLEMPAGEQVTGAFALHISTKYASGTIDYRPGAILVAADFIRLTIRGRGGHASAPHETIDPIPVAAEIVLALQAMVTRRVDVFDPAVVTIAHIDAGTTSNIIPETAFVEGTIRTASEVTRALVHAGVRRVVEGVCAAHDATAELEIIPGYPVTLNDPAFTAFAAGVAEEVLGADPVVELAAPIMGAEDFSYVLQRVPGAMFFVGARPPEENPATAPQNHSNRVVHHEPAMAVGAAVYAAVALRHLAGC